jgi:MiaB-like tRNA modifying enzyme
MLHRIGELVNTGKPLIVAGCLPKANKDLIEAKFPSASLLGPQALDKTLDTVKKAVEGQRAIMLQDSGTNKILLPRLRLNPIVSIIEIASGCVSLCSFCQTKLAKGQLRSHRIGDITRRIRNDVREGCKEIWLSSTDNGCYGRDLGSDLVDLLESCVAVRGDFKIRIGMMNPMYLPALKKRLIRILSDDNNIFKFLHIPLQSGSDSVLRKMMRGHTSKTFVDVVKEVRAEIPALTLATDVIVGFPTETDEDFRRTLEVVEITEPDIINISKYSARPGTKAARLKKLNSELIKERTKMMHTLANKIGLKRNSRWLKWEGEIVIDSRETKRLAGRNYAYKPIHIATSDDGSFLLGDNLFVRIEGITSHVLTGSVI